MIQFTRYYKATWIGSSGTRPTIAYDIWNQRQNAASRSVLPYSTNIAEGLHRSFNSMLTCSRPTIWKFLDCVKAEQSFTYMKKTKQCMKERPEHRNARWTKELKNLLKITEIKCLRGAEVSRCILIYSSN